MLVLTRKVDESVVIDDNVVVRILRIQGGRVCLGIQAPREIPITRAEILFDPLDAPAPISVAVSSH